MLSTVSRGDVTFAVPFDLAFFKDSSLCSLIRIDCLLDAGSSDTSSSLLESFFDVGRFLSDSDSDVVDFNDSLEYECLNSESCGCFFVGFSSHEVGSGAPASPTAVEVDLLPPRPVSFRLTRLKGIIGVYRPSSSWKHRTT